jgi:hypothetical protein
MNMIRGESNAPAISSGALLHSSRSLMTEYGSSWVAPAMTRRSEASGGC